MLREHREKEMAANKELSTIMGTLQQKNSLATSLERDISLVEMQSERLAATIDELSENNLQELAQLEFDDISETYVTRKYSEGEGEMISADVNEIELLSSLERVTSECTHSDIQELHSPQQPTEQGESCLESQLEQDSEIQLEAERESEGDDDEYKQAFSEKGGVRLELELNKQRLALQLRDNGRGELSLQLETESVELLRTLNERRKYLIRDLHGTGHRTRDFKCKKLYK